MHAIKSLLTIKYLGVQPYLPTLKAMQDFTTARNERTNDELWLLEHEAVFTLGQAGKTKHILDAHNIPVIKTDRGGQVTYHGIGQLVAYCLFDIKRLQLNSRQLVCNLEQVVINLLADFNIKALGDRDAPGVYVNDKKIAALGLRIRKGYSYHGLCFNVNIDLTPFTYINPCGVKDQPVTSLQDLGLDIAMQEIRERLTKNIKETFYQKIALA